MRTHFKLLFTSLIVALSFASSQASYSMDNRDQETNGSKNLQKKAEDSDFSKLPTVLKRYILELAAFEMGKDRDLKGTLAHCGVFASVCKNWAEIIKIDNEKNKGKIKKAWVYGYYDITTQQDKEIFEKFYNGKLIYRPDPKSDQGKIELLISALPNPLNGKFNLELCDNAGKYAVFFTGYKKGKKDENADKVEIGFAPRCLVEKEIKTTAKHLAHLFPNKWPVMAPVGIFWTLGSSSDLHAYYHLTNEDVVTLSINHLGENWRISRISSTYKPPVQRRSTFGYMRMEPPTLSDELQWPRNQTPQFQVHFVN